MAKACSACFTTQAITNGQIWFLVLIPSSPGRKQSPRDINSPKITATFWNLGLLKPLSELCFGFGFCFLVSFLFVCFCSFYVVVVVFFLLLIYFGYRGALHILGISQFTGTKEAAEHLSILSLGQA